MQTKAVVVASVLIFIIILSLMAQFVIRREHFDSQLIPCTFVSALTKECPASRKWNCIDGIPVRVGDDGKINFLSANVWGANLYSNPANCPAFISTMNTTNAVSDMNKIYDNAWSVSTCSEQCSAPSSCYNATVQLPAMNGCPPGTQANL